MSERVLGLIRMIPMITEISLTKPPTNRRFSYTLTEVTHN